MTPKQTGLLLVYL